jgi:hypothetical protein
MNCGDVAGSHSEENDVRWAPGVRKGILDSSWD